MEPNRIMPDDLIKTEVFNADGEMVGQDTNKGFRDIIQAVKKTFNAVTPPGTDIRNYVFKVINLMTGTFQRYRINDHGNLKLIV